MSFAGISWKKAYVCMYAWCQVGGKNLLANVDYGIVRKRCQQDYDAYQGEEWLCKNPFHLPSLHFFDAEAIRAGTADWDATSESDEMIMTIQRGP
jgi:hypothetical protein